MNICEEYAVLIQEYLDDELSGADRARVMEHLAQCDNCRAYFQQLTEMQDAFAAMDAEVPAGLSGRIMAQVKQTAQVPAKKKFRYQRYGMLAACLALVCIAGFIGLGGFGGASADNAKSESAGADFSMLDSTKTADDAEMAAESSTNGAPQMEQFDGGSGSPADAGSEETGDDVVKEPTMLVNGTEYPLSSTHVLLMLKEDATDEQEKYFASNSVAAGDIPSNVDNPEDFMLYLLPTTCYEEVTRQLDETKTPYFVTASAVIDAEEAGLLVMVPLNS